MNPAVRPRAGPCRRLTAQVVQVRLQVLQRVNHLRTWFGKVRDGRKREGGQWGDRGRARSIAPRRIRQQHGALLGGGPQRRARRGPPGHAGPQGRSLHLEVQGPDRAAAAALGRADQDRDLGAALPGAGESGPRAPARHGIDPVRRLSRERSGRDHAAAPPFPERHPPGAHRRHELHRRRGREHRVRSRRPGADSARYLAQPRQSERGARHQSERSRSAAGRDPEFAVFRARLHGGGGRQAHSPGDADRALPARLFAARLRRRRLAAAFRLASPRRRQRLADVRLPLRHDARDCSRSSATGTAIATRR